MNKLITIAGIAALAAAEIYHDDDLVLPDLGQVSLETYVE